jgi:hypothetical protein
MFDQKKALFFLPELMENVLQYVSVVFRPERPLPFDDVYCH